MKWILQEIMKKKYLEHQTLGRRVICPSEPTNQRIILWTLLLNCIDTSVAADQHAKVKSSKSWKKTIHFPWVLCMTSIKPNWTFDWSTLHYGKIYRYSRKWSYTSSLSWILRHTAAIFYALCRLGYKRLKSFQALHKRCIIPYCKKLSW